MVFQRIVADAQAAGLEVHIVLGDPPQGERLLKRVFGENSAVILREVVR